MVGELGGVVVGGDTGPVRLATAVGTHAVAFFGPTVVGRYGLDPRVGAWLQGLPGCEVRRPLAVTEQECWWSARCPLTGGDPACLADLSVDAVVAAALGTAAAPEPSSEVHPSGLGGRDRRPYRVVMTQLASMGGNTAADNEGATGGPTVASTPYELGTLRGCWSPEELRLVDAWWRAADYLAVGQIYLWPTRCSANRCRPST